MKEWFAFTDQLAPSVVKIETPTGTGTGFLCAYNEAKSLTAIATAYHVVEEADKWQQPIRLRVGTNDILLLESERVVWPDRDKATDSAVIITAAAKLNVLQLPEEAIPLLPSAKHLKVGVEVAWLGYPGIGPQTLCFFSGKVSAWEATRDRYLIDGVAIHGVSGGPVFFRTIDDKVQIIGAITQYIANRLTGESLPGLSVAQNVSHFHRIISDLKSRDEAARKKKEEEQAAIAATPTKEDAPALKRPD
jgi:S1-C subfamily serine protease